MKQRRSGGLWCAIVLASLLGMGCSVESAEDRAAPPPSDVTIERYPWLGAPEAVRWEEGFRVEASLEIEPPELATVPTEIVLPDRETWEIAVIIEAPDFEVVEGAPLQMIAMDREAASSVASFTLRTPPAAPVNPTPFSALISASYWFENRFLARVSKRVTIGEESLPPSPPLGEAVARVDLALDRDEADLVVTVVDRTLVLAAPELGSRPIVRTIEPTSAEDRRQLQQLYGELADVAATRNLGAGGDATREVDDAAARAAVVRAGRVLWQRLAPEAFKSAFWDLADRLGDDFDSLQIYADDPVIPWELMRPSRDGAPERGFLGLEFEVARGHLPRESGGFGQMPGLIPFERLLVMRPEYNPPLLGTADELRALEGFLLVSPEIIPSTYRELTRIAQDLPNGILHFAGHGVETMSEESGTQYSILLDRPVTLAEWLGLLPEPRFRNHPLIFFNACDVGKTHQSFGFAEGWAPAFLEAGAAGYIGTLWPVADRAAARFAIRFYHALELALRTGRGVGHPSRAIREARQLFTEDPDPTYLAYVYYGETDLMLALRP